MTNKNLTSKQQEAADHDSRQREFVAKLQTSCPILWRSGTNAHDSMWASPTPAWNDIVYECSVKLEALIVEHLDEIPTASLPSVAQVKEKFGSLRFYVDNDNKCIEDAAWEIIKEAEEKSCHICSSCGADEDATLRNKFFAHPNHAFGWVLVLCQHCWYEESLRRARISSQKELRQWFFETITHKKAAPGE